MPEPFRRSYSPRPKGNGAKEGLELKMKYWADKDYSYEYGVSLGAARGNLIVYLGGKRMPTVDEVYEEFRMMLEIKNDERFRKLFEAYYEKKHSLNARAKEKADQRLDEAENTVSDFGDADAKEEGTLL